MKTQLSTFLTFQDNNAEAAMNFYISLFADSKVIDIHRYGKEGPGKEGSVMTASFELNGKAFRCSDSFVKHNWNFTPAISIWVDCKDENELTTLFTKLSENGSVYMPLNNYGFSRQFGWVGDRFGVTWQLNLA
ncbi:VOC family protein [Chitinophaga sp. NPDC101104]|uniref:VOC family protein n=1 Tax=Chitinophaga sp. NPDC101104 TaxID=3390561 RepID=UPI003D02230D